MQESARIVMLTLPSAAERRAQAKAAIATALDDLRLAWLAWDRAMLDLRTRHPEIYEVKSLATLLPATRASKSLSSAAQNFLQKFRCCPLKF
jgi:hypothetical protein